MSLSAEQIQTFLDELHPRVQGELRTDSFNKMLYSTDASIYQVEPYGVLLPQVMEDVHAAVETAAKHGIPLLPRTAGSSLAGQAVNTALVIDFTRHLNAVQEVNEEEGWVRVQPGIVLDELNHRLKPRGLGFGPDPASSNRAAMGGIVSNNSTGSHSIVYGMTADHVLSSRVILSDGTRVAFGAMGADEIKAAEQRSGLEGDIYRQVYQLVAENAHVIQRDTPRHWRRCGGYNVDRLLGGEGVSFHIEQDHRFNLAKLICGAEGTLGVIEEVTLNLVKLPQMKAIGIVHFDDLRTALSAVPIILETEPSAVELIDNLGLTQCRGVPEYARILDTFIEGDPNCILITEFYGDSTTELEHKLAHLRDHLAKQGAGSIGMVPVTEPKHQANVWKVRKVSLGFLMSIPGDHKPIPFIEDAAVPVEHLAEYVTKLEDFCSDLGTQVAYYAHASAGCVHIRPLVNTKKAAEIAKLGSIIDFSVDLLRGYGGSLSSEHGDGRARSWANEAFFGTELYDLYRQTKRIFDPDNLMNPGNVVDAPAVDVNLRYGTDYNVIPTTEVLDFSAEQGFQRAVEMCNGAGICRKRTVDTMCPSFMATREEEHSTRGRANALRAAMSGQLPNDDLTSPRVYAAMDLCISCKACKSECPSSVDMGKIKFEYLAQYHQVHGTPLRARVFGNIAKLSRLNSGFIAPVVNWSMGFAPVKWGMQQMLGISAKRTLPAFARQPFTAWFKQRLQPTSEGRKQVVLFNDTFNTYNDPHVAIAATEVLEALGYAVVLPGHGCCGRPQISKGLVEAAREAAAETVSKLAPFARQGIPIVGLEPSCYLTLRDEYRYLLPDNEDVAVVAEQVRGFEELMAELDAAGELTLDFTEDNREVLLHGHCHQKALVGTDPSHATLGLPPNYDVYEVDSGCCGMAGSFGYEAEHYDVSQVMGERRLLPAVREASGETIIAAAGTSCRHQIEHGTDKRALHPAEVIRNAMRG